MADPQTDLPAMFTMRHLSEEQTAQLRRALNEANKNGREMRHLMFTGEPRSPKVDALRRHADALANAGADVINKPQSHSARAALLAAVADYTAWQIDGVR